VTAASGGAEGEFFWSRPSQNVYLLPQRPNLRLKRCLRPKQPAQIWMFLVVPTIGGALARYLFRLRAFEH
jgi:hypothetical protein